MGVADGVEAVVVLLAELCQGLVLLVDGDALAEEPFLEESVGVAFEVVDDEVEDEGDSDGAELVVGDEVGLFAGTDHDEGVHFGEELVVVVLLLLAELVAGEVHALVLDAHGLLVVLGHLVLLVQEQPFRDELHE